MPLHYNHGSPVLRGSQTFAFIAEKDLIFCGSTYLKEYISQITEKDLEEHFPGHGKQHLEEISKLKFKFKKEGSKVIRGQPLLLVDGDPYAIHVLHQVISTYIGGQSAVSTAANQFIEAAAKDKDGDEFAFLGLRRSPDDEKAAFDYAAWKGGFKFVANVNTVVFRGKFRYIDTTGLIVIGTIAHDWIASQTAIYKEAVVNGKLHEYLQALGIHQNNYDEAKAQHAAQYPLGIDLHDYLAFRAYITSVCDVESRLSPVVKKTVVLLVDTTDTIRGVRAAIKAAIDSGRPITGIRLDTTPEKYLKEAIELLEQAKIEYPDIFTGVKVYCTDGINLNAYTTIKEIYKKLSTSIKLVFGIGSELSNQDTVSLNAVKIGQSQIELTDYEHFCLQDSEYNTTQYESLAPADPYNKEEIPSDFYAWSQKDFADCINKRLEGAGVFGLQKRTSQLSFRHNADSKNYLIVAGVRQAVECLKNYRMSDDTIKMMKAQKLSYTDAEYEQMRGRKLELNFSYLEEGLSAVPYAPILTVTGHAGDVLITESFLLSLIGSMSSMTTEAHGLVNSVQYSAEDLASFDEDKKAYARSFKPEFVLDTTEQKNISTNPSYAAYLGGFAGSTMATKAHDIDIPAVQLGLNYADYKDLIDNEKSKYDVVCVDLKDVNPENLAHISSRCTIQICGNFDANTARSLRDMFVENTIPCKGVQFIIGKPVINAKNPKGIVFKPGAFGLALNAESAPQGYKHVYGIKPAGNKTPGGKNSIPGIDQRVVVLKKDGKPVARLLVEVSLLDLENIRRDENFDAALKAAIIKSLAAEAPQLYYSYDRSADKNKAPIALGSYDLGELNQYDLEICTTWDAELLPVKVALEKARELAKSSFSQKIHTLPFLMEAKMFNNLCSMLNSETTSSKQQLEQEMGVMSSVKSDQDGGRAPRGMLSSYERDRREGPQNKRVRYEDGDIKSTSSSVVSNVATEKRMTPN